jgi:hypothetical protein
MAREAVKRVANLQHSMVYVFTLTNRNIYKFIVYDKGKGLPQQAEVAQGVPGRLRPRIFFTFNTTRVVGQPYAPAAFGPGEIPGTYSQRLSRPQGTWFRREPRKKSPVTQPGIDPGTSRLAALCLNHYATSGPIIYDVFVKCNWVATRWHKHYTERHKTNHT